MKDEQEDRFSIFRFLVKKLDFILIFGFLVEKLEITRELLSGGHFPPCLRGGFRCKNYLLSENEN